MLIAAVLDTAVLIRGWMKVVTIGSCSHVSQIMADAFSTEFRTRVWL